MQAVLDGEVLQVAQPGIDAAQHLVGRRAGIDAGLAGEAAAPRRLDDQAGETVAAAAVEPVGLGVFVDQPLERAGVARKGGRDQRRRQVADGDRGDAALGLRRLAGIADDERIEHRQRPHHRFREARRGERDRLSRQPLQGAVGAHVHQRIDLFDVTQPQHEGEERMARRQRRVVVVGAARARQAAIRRQRDDDVAELRGTESEGAVAHIRVVRRRPPCRDHAVLDLTRQLGEEARVVVERQGGIARRQCIEQRLRRLGRRTHGIAGGAEIGEQRDDARRHVEPDRIAGAAGRAGIIGHQHRDAALFARRRGEPHLRRDAGGDGGDAVRLRAIGEGGEGEAFDRGQRVLERDRAGEHAPVELGEHDVHREIGGAEAARAVLPCAALGRREHRLEHRHAGTVERRRLAGLARGERGRGDDRGRREASQRRAHEVGGGRLLEARDHQRRRSEAMRCKRRAQGIDRRGIGGEQQRPVEDHRHHRPAGGKTRREAVEIDRTQAGQIAGAARHRLRLAQLAAFAAMPREPAEQRPQIFHAAFAEVAQQRRELVGRQGRGFGEPRIVAVLARQHRERDALLAGDGGEPLDAVAPPVEPADQPHQDHLGVEADTLHPEIDRHRVAQVAQMGEAHARQRGLVGGPGGGEAGEVAVGEREHRDVARRLAEIDRRDDVVEARLRGGEDVHR